MKQEIKTDVFVAGGGMAGWMAAVRAIKAGASVVMADKGFIGKAGQSVNARDFFVCNPEWGDDPQKVCDAVDKAGEYLSNRYWSERIVRESYDVFCELDSWDFGFVKDDNGNVVRNDKLGDLPVLMLKGAGMNENDYRKTHGFKARKHMEEIGVTLLDRVMVTELLRQDGRICGAIGISVDSDTVYVIEAGAVILCTGGSALRPAGYPCAATSTGDGERMAFELGAELAGKEFPQPMRSTAENPVVLGGRKLPDDNGIAVNSAFPVVNSKMWIQNGEPFKPHEGKNSIYPFAYLDLEQELHAGNGPITAKVDGKMMHVVTGGALGMSVRKADGIWPEDHECRSSLPGLFAAGDALGTMQNGALYMLCGGSMAGCGVTGAIAGEAAAKEALELRREDVRPEVKEAAIEKTLAPAKRKNGYSPSWIIQLIQNAMAPYYVSYVKKADRLQAALINIMFIKDHLVKNVKADDAHQLRLAHEVRGMVQVAEIRLRSALFRTESRGMHFREDYPFRDDENWLCWTKVKNEGGKAVMVKVPVPEEWRMDTDLSYEERYTYRFIGEEEARHGN